MTSGTLLEGYLAYYSQLASEHRELRGATVLHTPGSPLLGANAAYLHAGGGEEGLARAALWLHARGAAPLFAASSPLTGQAVERLRLGVYRPGGEAEATSVVEQVSSLHVARLAAVLAAAWQLPDWAQALALSLGRALEGQGGASWLAAYQEGQMVGALLLLGPAAHLWGVTRGEALGPLLNAAAELAGGEVVTSCPAAQPLALLGTEALHFSLGTVTRDVGGTLN